MTASRSPDRDARAVPASRRPPGSLGLAFCPRPWCTLLFLAAFTACRDAPELFTLPETPPPDERPYQLTFGGERDLRPTWSAEGDTIYYVRESAIVGPVGDTTRIDRLVFKLPADGGAAVRALPVLQPAGVAAPAVRQVSVSSKGRTAALILQPLHGPLCGEAFALCGEPVEPPPELRSATIRVFGSEDPPNGLMLNVAYPGRRFDTSNPPPGVTGLHVVEVFPFQRMFTETRRVPAGLSWSPDGDRLVYSDGVGLLVWDASSGTSTRITGSEDGIDPAWSPNGDWIAFERLERGAARETECVHRDGNTIRCIERRTDYGVPRRSLALIRPSGGDLRLLPEGRHPAWSHDGRHVYYEFADAVWRVGLGGADPTLVPGTENSVHPAPAPDGALLAVTRLDTISGTADLWILDAQPLTGTAGARTGRPSGPR